jgi:hypothetical protein
VTLLNCVLRYVFVNHLYAIHVRTDTYMAMRLEQSGMATASSPFLRFFTRSVRFFCVFFVILESLEGSLILRSSWRNDW